MKKITIDSKFFTANRERLLKNFKPDSMAIINSNDELFRNGDQYFPFRQSSDLFYLTGIEQEKCILTLCPHHPDHNLREIVFTIKPDETIAMKRWSTASPI
jgi:Xaa-Pro aminopeptidase